MRSSEEIIQQSCGLADVKVCSETVSDGSKFTGFRIYKYILDLSSQNGKQDQWPLFTPSRDFPELC